MSIVAGVVDAIMDTCGILDSAAFVSVNSPIEEKFLAYENQVGNEISMMTDPLSDMLARIRNALRAQKITVDVPYSQLKFGVAKLLEKEGYLQGVEVSSAWKHPMLQLTLSYGEQREPTITHLRRVSKPGCRVYVKSHEMPSVMTNYGIAIVSTSNGLMTNKEARVRRLGGEIICEVA